MKTFLTIFWQWLRHKIQVVILKQWKKPETIYENWIQLCNLLNSDITDEEIRQPTSRLGLYRKVGRETFNFLST